ncbi:MAG: hypothetical protein K9J16_10075 [Melioribacteraceae bacterium]|nr:hypothetical protein [Melioribacteraceae bacterium]MCF8354282.1 hypothetical protein [Melioribacteraceae bacterium]MCF8394586.1 hypothetical protein [Melioribacteraceae bacterium]MCF8419745.1 hypothetical protein [Melioribacteraceae bacterium]
MAVKVIQKKIKRNGKHVKIALYLSYFKKGHPRKYESLGLYFQPKDPVKEPNRIMELAQKIRLDKEFQWRELNYNYDQMKSSKIDLFENTS